MEVDFVSSLLMGGGLLVLLLCVGLLLLSVAYVPLSLRELKMSTSFLLSRPVIDLNICTTTWVLIGWGLANGGDIGLFLGVSEYSTIGTASYELWFYQFTLLYTSVVIYSNASLPRQINGYARCSCLLFYAVAVFPVLYHWLWSIGGWASPYRSFYKEDLLSGCGVLDSAGSSIIHMSSGCASLVLMWLVRPRVTQLYMMEDAQTIKDEAEKACRADAAAEISTGQNEGDEIVARRKSNDCNSPPKKIEKPTIDEFRARQVYSNVASPVLMWLGFIGLNAITNLPGSKWSDIAGKRCVRHTA